MHGNVWEYCPNQDNQRPAGQSPPQDSTGCVWTLRGGTWDCPPYASRSGLRFTKVDWISESGWIYVGFRVVCEIERKPNDGTSVAAAAEPARAVAEAELVDVVKIWDRAPYNAFTDLIRFQNRWHCVFREGQSHRSKDGVLRVLTSADGRTWTSLATVADPDADLRDPKFSITPDGQLMLLAVAALKRPTAVHHQSMAWFSADGRDWTAACPVGDPNLWLWSLTWHKGTGYSVGYDTTGQAFVHLYRTRDGKTFEMLVEKLYAENLPSESSLVFAEDDTCFCLLRRDGGDGVSGALGTARPPYGDWSWKGLNARIAGPKLIQLRDGRLVTTVRLYDGDKRTSLCWIDAEEGKLHELLELPSGGDTGYAGMVWHEGMLWVSYYASHEDKTSVYLARVKLKDLRAGR